MPRLPPLKALSAVQDSQLFKNNDFVNKLLACDPESNPRSKIPEARLSAIQFMENGAKKETSECVNIILSQSDDPNDPVPQVSSTKALWEDILRLFLSIYCGKIGDWEKLYVKVLQTAGVPSYLQHVKSTTAQMAQPRNGDKLGYDVHTTPKKRKAELTRQDDVKTRKRSRDSRSKSPSPKSLGSPRSQKSSIHGATGRQETHTCMSELVKDHPTQSTRKGDFSLVEAKQVDVNAPTINQKNLKYIQPTFTDAYAAPTEDSRHYNGSRLVQPTSESKVNAEGSVTSIRPLAKGFTSTPQPIDPSPTKWKRPPNELLRPVLPPIAHLEERPIAPEVLYLMPKKEEDSSETVPPRPLTGPALTHNAFAAGPPDPFQIRSSQIRGLPFTRQSGKDVVSKPNLPRLPPIWAQTRQEICETFPWFRSFQGGVYFDSKMAKGYLLGGFPAENDLWHHNGKLIISHGGGCAESVHVRRGAYELQSSHDQNQNDKSSRALLNSQRLRNPVALVIDDKYSKFPYKLRHESEISSDNQTQVRTTDMAYVVLGWYRIIDSWAERDSQTSSIRLKFAFQWCEDQDDPWWFEEKEPADVVSRKTTDKCEYYSCDVCQQTSPVVYANTRVCLKPSCVKFWFFDTLPEELLFNKTFLTLRNNFDIFDDPIPILMPPIQDRLPEGDITTSEEFIRGLHCGACGRLSCRSMWEHWRCSHCGIIYKHPGKLRVVNEFWDLERKLENVLVRVKDGSGVIAGKKETVYLSHCDNESEIKRPGSIQTFLLPLGEGKIHHISPGNAIARKESSSIFRAYQEQANTGSLRFRRWPMRSHKCRGDLLTHYFSQNTGEPYYYVGGTDNTISFEESPPESAVVKARGLIQRRLKEALNLDVVFNEILSAAYMRTQSMAYHCDSEKGLGPVVAGFSMGAPAVMHFRKKREYIARHVLFEDDYTRLADLSIVLKHGDVLVMEGHGVQNCYEHTVIPKDFRMAATARFISPQK